MARYAAHRAFYAPALKTPGLRPTVLAFIIVETLYEMAQRLFGEMLSSISDQTAEHVFTGDTPLGLTASLASFALLAGVLQLVMHLVHGRGLRSLTGPPGALIAQFRAVFPRVILLLLLIEVLPPWWNASEVAEMRPPLVWLAMLPLGLAALFIQIGAEELFYRGYLQQQVAAWNPRPIFWLVLPNIAFALAHWGIHAPLASNLQYVTWAFVFGLAASDLTARTGSLGPALALHFANNIFAFFLYGQQAGPDSGLALLLFKANGDAQFFSDMPEPGGLPYALLVELIIVGLAWGTARVALRR